MWFKFTLCPALNDYVLGDIYQTGTPAWMRNVPVSDVTPQISSPNSFTFKMS